MKKKLSLLSLIAFMILALSSCTNRTTLLFLNWGEYIDESLLDEFEEMNNCTVLMDLGESNEIFYSKVFAGTTVYDVVCPSDYMVMKMYNKGLIDKIDYSRLENKNYNPDSDDLRDGILSIRKDMVAETDENIKDYYVPYLWGTWGIMYSTKKAGLEEAVRQEDNPNTEVNENWVSLFDRDKLPSKDIKVAMYDSHQHAYYAACRYLGLPTHKELPQSDLDRVRKLVEKMDYNAWGTDNIKKQIVAGNLHVGFMWTGDFLYYYAEQSAYRTMRALIDKKITADEVFPFLDAITDSDVRIYNGLKDYEVGFDIYIPEDTIAFCDNLVVVKDKQRSEKKTDLIYKFIDFLCSKGLQIDDSLPKIDDIDEDTMTEDEITEIEENYLYPANTNTQYVCYDTPFKSIYGEILDLKDDSGTTDGLSKKCIEELLKTAKSDDAKTFNDSDPFWAAYNYALAIAFEKYYPEDGKVGSILGSFDRKYVNLINNTFNNARA